VLISFAFGFFAIFSFSVYLDSWLTIIFPFIYQTFSLRFTLVCFFCICIISSSIIICGFHYVKVIKINMYKVELNN